MIFKKQKLFGNNVLKRNIILFAAVCIVILFLCSVYAGFDMAENGMIYKTDFGSYDIMTINECFGINLDNNTNIVKGRYYKAKDPGVLFWIKGIDDEKIILQQCRISSDKIDDQSIISSEEINVEDAWKYKISDNDEIFFYMDPDNSLNAVLHKTGFDEKLYSIFADK